MIRSVYAGSCPDACHTGGPTAEDCIDHRTELAEHWNNRSNPYCTDHPGKSENSDVCQVQACVGEHGLDQ